MPELLTFKEAADKLRISKRTVERLVASRQLRPIRIGRRALISDREIDAYVAHLAAVSRKG